MEKISIAEHLRKIRLEHNLKQKEIAQAVGIDRSAYSFYETGKTRPSVETLYAISKIYNVSVGYLIGKDKSENDSHTRKAEVNSSVDPIAFLPADERELLMYYRVADEQQKKEILAFCSSEKKED